MSKPNRLYVTFHDEQFNLRVQPHRDDEATLVVKAKHPEAIDQLAILSGMDLGIKNRVQGGAYFVCFVDRVSFVQAVAEALLLIEEPPAVPEEIGEIPSNEPEIGYDTFGAGADDIPDA